MIYESRRITNEHCPNTLGNKHKVVINANGTHKVCVNCGRLGDELPEDFKNELKGKRYRPPIDEELFNKGKGE